MQTQLNKYTSNNRYCWTIIAIVLMMALGSNAVRAQDNGTSPAATQSSPSTSTQPSTSTAPSTSTTTTTEAPATSEHSYSSESVQGIGTNTWILIGIGVIAVLLLGILIARSSRTKETISRTTVIK